MKNIWYILLVFAFLSNSYAQSWQKIAPMPGGARDAIICFSIGNVIYSGGGPKKDFYAYDAQKGSWTRKADLPGVGQNRAFSFSFSIAGKGYIGTGTDSGVSILKSDLWEYDPSLNSWIQKADFPGGDRDGLGVFVVNGKAYVGGGADAALNVYSDFYEYDPAENKWNMKAELPGGPNIFASMFAIGNYGYLACGSGIVEYQDLYRYDPTMDSWDALSPLPGDARQAGIGFVLRGKGYVGLGMSGYSTVYTDMYSYDPAKDEWSPETDLPATGRAWSSAVVIGDTAYIGDGASLTTTSLNTFSDWWKFSLPAASVAQDKKNVEIRCYPQPAGNQIHIAGLNSGLNYESKIIDELGREVMRRSITSDNSSLDIHNLPQGMYTVIMQSSSDPISVRFVKE